jgi:hypothetical protein
MNCGIRTHRKYWDENRCPICGIESGFVEMAKGGLRERQIAAAKSEFLGTQVNPETLRQGVERELG